MGDACEFQHVQPRTKRRSSRTSPTSPGQGQRRVRHRGADAGHSAIGNNTTPSRPPHTWAITENDASTKSTNGRDEAALDPKTAAPQESPKSIEVDHSRFIQDRRGSYVFIGDSANLSLLHTVRCAASEALGPCPFVDDPLRSSIVEGPGASTSSTGPNYTSNNLNRSGEDQPSLPVLSQREAADLVHDFFASTDGVVDLFDRAELLAALPHCLGQGGRRQGNSPNRAIALLVVAIGAQSRDDPRCIASAYFNHVRASMALLFDDDLSVRSTQLCVLTTLYLLGASRRNAAFVCLGYAVRAAYALGIHQQTVPGLLSEVENRDRRRLWASIRVVDLFTSASLGRPPSTSNGKPAPAPGQVAHAASATDELYAILETILTDVYGQRKITKATLAMIGSRLRKWAAKFSRAPSPAADADIASMHPRQTYYWNIMLLTRPFLVDSVTAHSKMVAAAPRLPVRACTTTAAAAEAAAGSSFSKTLVHACIDSAINVVSLLEPLGDMPDVPYHLPVLINAAFHAALVLGYAFFGDLHVVFPLQRYLNIALDILRLFPHDGIALRYFSIVQYLRDACIAYSETRLASSMDAESETISSWFGQIHPPRRNKSRVDAASQASPHVGQRHSSPHRQSNGQQEPVPVPNAAVANNAAGTIFDTIMFSSPDTGSESDIFAQLDMQTGLDIDFPATTQHVWVNAHDFPFPSMFASISAEADAGTTFLEP